VSRDKQDALDITNTTVCNDKETELVFSCSTSLYLITSGDNGEFIVSVIKKWDLSSFIITVRIEKSVKITKLTKRYPADSSTLCHCAILPSIFTEDPH